MNRKQLEHVLRAGGSLTNSRDRQYPTPSEKTIRAFTFGVLKAQLAKPSKIE